MAQRIALASVCRAFPTLRQIHLDVVISKGVALENSHAVTLAMVSQAKFRIDALRVTGGAF